MQSAQIPDRVNLENVARVDGVPVLVGKSENPASDSIPLGV